MSQNLPAILVLADGTVFRGMSIGASGHTVAEVVFNTSMTGYQEILTDPSYCRQIVTLTYPHIGNYGINEEDVEADAVHAAGLIIKDLPLLHSNFRASSSLGGAVPLKVHSEFGCWIGRPGWKRGAIGLAGLMPELRADGTPGL